MNRQTTVVEPEPATNRTPDGVMAQLMEALARGDVQGARLLAEQGCAEFPDHDNLRRAAIALAPPRVVRRNIPPDSEMAANSKWLRMHSSELRGKWVAVKDAGLIA